MSDRIQYAEPSEDDEDFEISDDRIKVNFCCLQVSFRLSHQNRSRICREKAAISLSLCQTLAIVVMKVVSPIVNMTMWLSTSRVDFELALQTHKVSCVRFFHSFGGKKVFHDEFRLLKMEFVFFQQSFTFVLCDSFSTVSKTFQTTIYSAKLIFFTNTKGKRTSMEDAMLVSGQFRDKLRAKLFRFSCRFVFSQRLAVTTRICLVYLMAMVDQEQRFERAMRLAISSKSVWTR